MARAEIEGARLAPRGGAALAAPAGTPVGAAPEARVSRIVVGFSTPRGWNPLSAAIRRFTGSRASHAWLRVHDPLFGRDMVIEAHATGMRLIPFSLFRRTNRIVAIAYPSCDLGRGVAAAGAWLGRPYDVEGLLGLFLVLLERSLGRRTRNLCHGAAALFCSEAVVMTLQAGGFPCADSLSPDDTTPEDLLEFLQHAEGCSRVVFNHGVPTSATPRRRRRVAQKDRRRGCSDLRGDARHGFSPSRGRARAAPRRTPE
jgi:hypothetical protein